MWLLPSLDRPASLARFFAAWRETRGSTPGFVIVDLRDRVRNDALYRAVELPPGWAWRFTEAVSQGDKIRELWDEIRDCGWLGLIGDDCIPETAGWDRAMVGALDGLKPGIVSCDDCWQAPQRVGNCWVMSGALVQIAGYIFPPALQHLYVDDVWETIGRDAGCRATLMGVRVRHAHVLKGEAPPDDTHRAVYGADRFDPNRGLWPEDRAAFTHWAAGGERDRISAAIAAARRPAPAARGPEQPAQAGVFSAGGQPVAGPDLSDEAVERRRARLKTRSVLILTPSLRHPTFGYTISFAETCVLFERLGIPYSSYFVRMSSNLPRVRNELAARFLASDFTDALYIDDDMSWSANSAVRLLASEQLVIGAVGRKKVEKPATDPNVWCVNVPGGPVEQDEMGNARVRRVGTGFLKVSREAFERLTAAYPERKRNGPPDMPEQIRRHYYQLFRFGDDDMSEDFVFCDDWTRIGGTVWIDPTITLGHTGEKTWRGRIADIMLPAPSAEAAVPEAA